MMMKKKSFRSLFVMILLLCALMTMTNASYKRKRDHNDTSESSENPILESSFQKLRWSQCCIFLINKKLSVAITRIILSYLTFTPRPIRFASPAVLLRGALSRNSQWLVTVAQDCHKLSLWDVGTGQVVRNFTTPDECRFHSCAIADNHSFLVGWSKKNLRLWNTESAERVTSPITCMTNVVGCCIFARDTLIATSHEPFPATSNVEDVFVEVWQVDATTQMCRRLHKVCGRTKVKVGPLTGEQSILLSLCNRRALVWNPYDKKTIRDFPGQVQTIEHYVISYDNKYMATMVNGVAKIWAIDTGKEIATIKEFNPLDNQADEFCYLSEKRLVWRHHHYHSKVGIWDIKTKQRIALFRGLAKVKIVRVSEDNKYLMILLEDGLMKVYNFETLEEYPLN